MVTMRFPRRTVRGYILNWHQRQQPVKFIQGIAAVWVKLQQMRTLTARMIQVDESRQPQNPPPSPNVVSADCYTQPLVQVFHPVNIVGGLIEEIARLHFAKAGFDHP